MGKTSVPYLLDFDGRNGFKPGRGRAGWTVAEFTTHAEALDFMARYPEARMPCWARIESSPFASCASSPGAQRAGCEATRKDGCGDDQPSQIGA